MKQTLALPHGTYSLGQSRQVTHVGRYFKLNLTVCLEVEPWGPCRLCEPGTTCREVTLKQKRAKWGNMKPGKRAGRVLQTQGATCDLTRKGERMGWFRGAWEGSADRAKVRQILVQRKVGQRRGSFLVTFGVFNLPAMASHCRIWGKWYKIIGVVFKRSL